MKISLSLSFFYLDEDENVARELHKLEGEDDTEEADSEDPGNDMEDIYTAASE